MKKITRFLFLILAATAFSKSLKDDLAYRLVMEKLDGTIPESFVTEAFSHDKLKVHKEIADKFARPYEKKPWVEYRKIFVKESRIVAGEKFYANNKELIQKMIKYSHNTANGLGNQILMICKD